MALTGVKDDIGKYRHDLFEAGSFFQEFRPQTGHFRPKTDARHAEVALHALLQVAVEAFVLRLVETVAGWNVDGIGSSLTVREVRGVGLQPHLMRHDPQPAQLRQTAGNGFRKCDAVKYH